MGISKVDGRPCHPQDVLVDPMYVLVWRLFRNHWKQDYICYHTWSHLWRGLMSPVFVWEVVSVYAIKFGASSLSTHSHCVAMLCDIEMSNILRWYRWSLPDKLNSVSFVSKEEWHTFDDKPSKSKRWEPAIWKSCNIHHNEGPEQSKCVRFFGFV